MATGQGDNTVVDIKKHLACAIWGGPGCEPANHISNLGVTVGPVSKPSRRRTHGLRSTEEALRDEAQKQLFPATPDTVATSLSGN